MKQNVVGDRRVSTRIFICAYTNIYDKFGTQFQSKKSHRKITHREYNLTVNENTNSTLKVNFHQMHIA